jgi:hypothetical protein
LAALGSYELTARILADAISSRDDQMLGDVWNAERSVKVARISSHEVREVWPRGKSLPQLAWALIARRFSQWSSSG